MVWLICQVKYAFKRYKNIPSYGVWSDSVSGRSAWLHKKYGSSCLSKEKLGYLKILKWILFSLKQCDTCSYSFTIPSIQQQILMIMYKFMFTLCLSYFTNPDERNKFLWSEYKKKHTHTNTNTRKDV